MEKELNRIGYVDLYKGIGIILMIISHIVFGKYSAKIITSFNMPMFFFISGFLFTDKYSNIKFKDFFVKKAKSLLIPYLFFGVFHYFVYEIKSYPFFELRTTSKKRIFHK